MEQVFEAHGIRFRFPEGWELIEDRREHEVTVTVASPGTSFWSVTLFFARPSPERVIESALDAFRHEYDDLDIYRSDTKLCDLRTESRDIEFVCLELINSAFLRAIQVSDFTVLVLFQGTDHELKQTRPILDRISNSLAYDPSEDRLIV